MQIDFKNKVYVGSNQRKSVFDCQIPNEPKAVIIFMHGYKGYKDWGAWQLLQDYFVSNNYGFVKFNASHNGGTVNNPIDFEDLEAFGNNRYSYELRDLSTIINETERLVKQELNLDIPIHLIGHSRGGGIATLAAHHPFVSKIISLAGISDIAGRFPKGEDLDNWKFDGVYYVKNGRTHQEMPHYYSFYEDFLKYEDELDIEAAANNLEKPFLQVHGDMDLAVSISEGIRMSEYTDTELAIVKGAGHTFGATHPWEGNKLPEDLATAAQIMLAFFKGENKTD